MYVGMCVCMYVCTYVCIYVSMYVRMYASMYVRMYLCMYVRMYVCLYVCMFICMYINRSLPSSVGIKNTWSLTSTPFAFTVLCLMKHKADLSSPSMQ